MNARLAAAITPVTTAAALAALMLANAGARGADVPLVAYSESGQNAAGYRTWDGSAWSGESSTASLGGVASWIVTAACPARIEVALVGLDASADVNLVFYDGSTWGSVTELTADAEGSNERAVHAAYEHTSGDLLICYWSNADDKIGYRTWNGTTLSGQSLLTLPTTSRVRFIKLAANPTSDEIMLAYLNDDKRIYVCRWSGSAWGTVTQKESDTSLELIEVFDLAYEQQSGHCMLAFRDNAQSNIRYMMWDGSNWSAEAAGPNISAGPYWIRLAADPASDEIIVGAIDSDSDVNVCPWTGSAWGSLLEVTTESPTNARRGFDLAYECGGNEALVAYAESGSNNVRYRTWNGSSWSSEQSGVSAGSVPRVIQLVTGATTGEIFVGATDEGSDLELFRWSGSALSAATQAESTTGGLEQTEPFMFTLVPNRTLAVADHANGQEPDAFTLAGSQTNAELVGFALTPGAGTVTVTQLVFRLTASAGLVDGDWAGVEVIVDANGDGAIGGGETTAVGGAGSVSHAAGTITFSTSFTVSAATSYILRADFAPLASGDTVTIGLDAADITSGAVESGSTTPATHSEANFTADVLLVVSDAVTLTAQDSAKKALIEGWGYRVVPIAATATQAQFDAIVPTMDVAYVSEEILSGDLSTKLTSKTIAVLVEENASYDEFGLATTATSYTSATIDVTDTGHYITEAFAGGVLTLFSAGQPLQYPSGSLGGYQTLAERPSSSSPTLVVMEPGASLAGGGTAAGRRVGLPWGGSALDITTITADGETLMQRAIEWGHGPISHWKLDDGSGTTAADSRGSNDGTVSSGTWTTGRDGGGMEFNGSTDYVAIASSATLQPTTAITIAAWVKGDAWGSGSDVDTILRKGEANPINWQLAIAGGKVSLVLDANDDAGHVGNTTLSTGTWYHVAATWDGSKVRIYVNGVLDNTPATKASPIGTDTRAAYIGGRSGADLFDGIIDDVRLYNYALSRKEIAALMTASTIADLLLVVGNPASLTSQESLRKSQFETWGYDVTLIDESDSQANFDAAVAAADVAYVPEDVSASALSTKLVSASIGVVIEQGESHDDFGLAAGAAGSQSATQIDIPSSGHFITQPFATGNLTICSSSQPMNSVTGSIARDGQVLAEWPSSSDGALAVLDAGARLASGGRAAGRRVFLPVGDGAFDWAALAADGLTIVERSLEWARGLLLHYRLDETSGTTAADSIGGYDATLTSMDPANDWQECAIDNGLDFDGSDDRAVTSATVTPPTAGTLAFWMKVPGAPAAQGRILGTDETWEIRHVTTGTTDGIPYGLVFDLGVSGANAAFVTTTTVDDAGHWYHVAAAYDVAAGTYAVYLDGALHKSGTTTLTEPVANTLSIGTTTGTANYFTGTLDDIRLMDYVMGADEVLALYEMRTRALVRWQETDPD